MTHRPKRSDCDVCQAAKMVRYKYSAGVGTAHDAEKFGEHLTMDHIVAKGAQRSGRNHEYVLTIYDVATKYLSATPVLSNSEPDTRLALLRFLGKRTVGKVYVDRALELKKALETLGIPPDLSLAGRSQTNAIVERQNREINPGARAALLQAGLPPPFWDFAVQHVAHAYNTQINEEDGTSPWFKRHGEHFKGQRIPFGAKVSFIPTTTSKVGKDVHKFAPTSVVGVFLGYELQVGERWTGRYRVAPLSEFDRIPLSVHTALVQCKIEHQVVVEVSEYLEPVGMKEGTETDSKCDEWWKFPCRSKYEEANGTLLGMSREARKRAEQHSKGEQAISESEDATEHSRPDNQLDLIPVEGREIVAGKTKESKPSKEEGMPDVQRGSSSKAGETAEGSERPSVAAVPQPKVVPSGHEWYIYGGVPGVNPRHPSIPAKEWESTGSNGRLKKLNQLRSRIGLRTTKDWEQMLVYLKEEHAPYLLPQDHVMPDGRFARDVEVPQSLLEGTAGKYGSLAAMTEGSALRISSEYGQPGNSMHLPTSSGNAQCEELKVYMVRELMCKHIGNVQSLGSEAVNSVFTIGCVKLLQRSVGCFKIRRGARMPSTEVLVDTTGSLAMTAMCRCVSKLRRTTITGR